MPISKLPRLSFIPISQRDIALSSGISSQSRFAVGDSRFGVGTQNHHLDFLPSCFGRFQKAPIISKLAANAVGSGLSPTYSPFTTPSLERGRLARTLGPRPSWPQCVCNPGPKAG
jgi:hypothetical protein